jgi:SAM-dependent methyltransferase
MAFEELKQRSAVAWGAAPFEQIEDTIAVMHDDLVSRLDPQPGEAWLDLGCGTGAVAMRAARAGAEVRGVDLSPVMVETACRRAAEEGLSIAYEVGDAEAVPAADGAFDIVSSSVGAIFAPDHAAVARELARVVRPGGRIGFTAWRPGSGLAKSMQLAAQFGPPPPEGAGNPFQWASEEYAESMLGDSFELEFHDGDAVQTGDSGEALWDYLYAGLGPLRLLSDSLGPEQREELHRGTVEIYEADRQGDQIVQSRPYLVVVGRRR